MRKVLIIKGYSRENQLSKLAIDELQDIISNLHIIDLNEIGSKGCAGCDYCQSINPGICCMNDIMGTVLSEYLDSDLVFIISPIRFGCFNSMTKEFVDRTEPLFLPYQVKKKKRTVMMSRYDKYPKIIFVGITDTKSEKAVWNFRENVINSNLALTSPEANTIILSCEIDSVCKQCG